MVIGNSNPHKGISKEDIAKYSDKELKNNLYETGTSIHQIQCFNTKDLIYFEWLCQEADKRGWTVFIDRKVRVDTPEE
ncbi:hypothetical protein LCGC14_3153730 [marine sediment metagenome]|uniref:Uncharacterized protein n=1 Tax=marine sediment metagenome TaxID=412755 RepID=A0A0F8VTC4_9ZZZZ